MKILIIERLARGNPYWFANIRDDHGKELNVLMPGHSKSDRFPAADFLWWRILQEMRVHENQLPGVLKGKWARYASRRWHKWKSQ